MGITILPKCERHTRSRQYNEISRMKRTFVRFRRGCRRPDALSACKQTPPANVAAEVNGHAITYAELDKIYQSQYPQPCEGSNEDQVMSNKLEVLNSLITNEIMLQRAEKLGLTAVDADVEAEFNKMKAPYTKEEFDKQLAARHMTLDDLKAQIRRDLTVNKLINKEITRTSPSPTPTSPTSTTPTRRASIWPSRRSTWRRSWSRRSRTPTSAI